MKTPRTDERATWIGKPERDGAEVVMADFARQLETELAEANAGIAQWAQTCGQYKTERDDATSMIHKLTGELNKALEKVAESYIENKALWDRIHKLEDHVHEMMERGEG
jgi:septal ring factor EnvC (AmiA/AmiB activator)